MDQNFFFLGLAIIISFGFFLLFFLGSHLVMRKHEAIKSFVLPFLTSLYVFTVITLLYEALYINIEDILLSRYGIPTFFLLIGFYMILFPYIYFDKKKEGTLRHFLVCIGFVVSTIVVSRILYFGINPTVVLSKSKLLLASTLFLVLLFLSIRLIQQIFIDKAINHKNIPHWVLVIATFFTSISIVIGILDIIRSIQGFGNHSILIGEILMILFLLVITSIYSEKQFYEKQTQWLKTKEHLHYLAYHDPLTKLANRRKVVETMEEWVENHTPFALYFIDLDHFKHVNDLLGHDVGDYLLKQMGKRLNELIEKSDIVGRIGGDEFIILNSSIKQDEISEFAEKLIATITAPIYLNDQEMIVTTSIGASHFPSHSTNTIELLKKADIAMYRSKDNGRNSFYVYEKQLDEEVIRSITLKEDLKLALKKEQFEIHYQPKIEIINQKITGFEALLRWKHPDLGNIPPSEFIPIAEETNTIVEIGNWVLENACKDIYELNTRTNNQFRISVNFSIKQLIQKDVIQSLSHALEKSNLDPKLLELEITENVAIRDLQVAIQTLKNIKELGIHISIDDYGTGYNSLSILQNLSIHRLKIDSSFIQEIDQSVQSNSIISSIIAMARHLGLFITAEGVETIEQFEFLKNIGCDEAQGFYFSEPIPINEVDHSIHLYLSEEGLLK